MINKCQLLPAPDSPGIQEMLILLLYLQCCSLCYSLLPSTIIDFTITISGLCSLGFSQSTKDWNSISRWFILGTITQTIFWGEGAENRCFLLSNVPSWGRIVSLKGPRPGTPWEYLSGCMECWRYSAQKYLLNIETIIFFDISTFS